jgi:hypothetical protein
MEEAKDAMALVKKRVECMRVDMVTKLGMKGGRTYKPRFQNRNLEELATAYRVRVLTDQDIDQLEHFGQVGPAPLLGAASGHHAMAPGEEMTLFILSMLRLTYHPDRMGLAQACLEAKLLPQVYKAFVKDLQQKGGSKVPVPGCMSSGAFANLLPLLVHFLARLDGLNVGRIIVLVFFDDEYDGLNLHRAYVEKVSNLQGVLANNGVDQRLAARWIEQVQECAEALTEDHHYITLDVKRILDEGTGFLIDFTETNPTDYVVVAKHAALRGERKPHGSPELFGALSRIVWEQLKPEVNPFLTKFDPKVLSDLQAIHRASSYFFIEDCAYKDARNAEGGRAGSSLPNDAGSSLPKEDELGELKRTGHVEWILTSTRAPLVENPHARTVPLIAGDAELYIGGSGINGAFAAEFASRIKLPSQELKHISSFLHCDMLGRARVNDCWVEGEELQRKLKIVRSYVCCAGMKEEPLCGVAIIHFMDCDVFGPSTPAVIYAVGPKGDGSRRGGANIACEKEFLHMLRVTIRNVLCVAGLAQKEANIESLRWCLLSGGTYRHSAVSAARIAKVHGEELQASSCTSKEFLHVLPRQAFATMRMDTQVTQQLMRGTERLLAWPFFLSGLRLGKVVSLLLLVISINCYKGGAHLLQRMLQKALPMGG